MSTISYIYIELFINWLANSILSFNSITDLFGTDFSTDFALDTSLSGSRDYTFNVFYHPSDLGADSAILHIESNGGSLYLYLFGKTFTTTSANNNGVQNGSIVYNNHSKTIQLANLCSEGQYKLYDILGNVRMEGIVTDSYQTISCEHLSKGLYVFSLYQNGHKTNIKFFL